MTRTSAFILALSSLALTTPVQAGGPPASASAWEIGPIYKGRSLSPGMPQYAFDARNGAYFDFPWPTSRAGSVHYVTRPTGSLTDAKRMVLRYRIEGERGVRFLAKEDPRQQGELTLYFQRRGDNWTAKGRYGTYRWYAPVSTMAALTPGTHEVVVPFDANWGSVYAQTRESAPEAYAQALANAGRIGFVLGSRGGRGHGVFATAPARFTILDFRVE